MTEQDKKSLKKGLWLWAAGVMLGGLLFLALHDVPVAVTAEDKAALASILSKPDITNRNPAEMPFEEQIRQIRAIQQQVLGTAPHNAPLPKGQTREPADLLKAGSGYCYDRSRTIEKALRALGYDVRHVSIYELQGDSPLKTFFTPDISSHAVSEARTARGWVVIDSNAPWLALDKHGAPYAAQEISDKVAQGDKIEWANTETANKIYQRPTLVLYGLYSRHGMFYPPYTPFPDIYWPTFLDNFI